MVAEGPGRYINEDTTIVPMLEMLKESGRATFLVTNRGKRHISRPATMVAVMAPTAGAFFLLLNKTDLALYTSTAVIGICTGIITSIAISTTTELFGTKNFSVNHNVVVANIPIGSFLFGYSAAILYRKKGHDQNGTCIGMECYTETFFIWGCFSLLGTFLAFILYARTRKFYSDINKIV